MISAFFMIAEPQEEETKIFRLPTPRDKTKTPEFQKRLAQARANISENIRAREAKILPFKELYDRFGKSIVFFITSMRFKRNDQLVEAFENHQSPDAWQEFATEENPDFTPCELTIEEVRTLIKNHPEYLKKTLEIPNGILMTKDGEFIGCWISLKTLKGERVKTMQFLDHFGTINPPADDDDQEATRNWS